MFYKKNLYSLVIFYIIMFFFIYSCEKKESTNNDSKFLPNSMINNKDIFCTDLNDKIQNPLGPYQWHLKNTGQTAFASEYGTANEDINVDKVLKEYCLSGFGVHIAIVDSGLQLLHPSLHPNIINNNKTKSINFRENELLPDDPSPIPDDDSDHGTMVGGIIAMRSNLGFGGSGVAPRAKLTGYNVINNEPGVQVFENFVDSLGGSDASKKNDIFNLSYGDSNTSQIPSDDPIVIASVTAYRYGVRNLRNGKGALYVKAAGNGFIKINEDPESNMECATAQDFQISCQNSNMNIDNTLPEVITVGALNAKGKKASYSTTGSSLWISAPGGEFGYNKNWLEKYFKRFGMPMHLKNLFPIFGEPAIITTDVVGSKYGLSKLINYEKSNAKDSELILKEIFNIRNAFNAGQSVDNNGHKLNSEYNYTNSMNGTSSATPIVSGSIALILEENPKLTWRDIKYILAKTATKVHHNFAGIKVKIYNNEEYQAEDGWITNSAGFHFSNWYGFGRVNVEKAVNLAKNYKFNLGDYVEIPWHSIDRQIFPAEIPPGAVGHTYDFQKILKIYNVKIESVRVKVSVESDYIGDVGFELTSPHGTKSIIWNIGNAFSFSENLVNMPMQSNAFYGENSLGVWKLKVINSGVNSNIVKFKGARIQFSGSKI